MSMAIATSGVCFLAWLAVAYKFPRLVQYAANPAVRSYWLAYLLLAFALTLLQCFPSFPELSERSVQILPLRSPDREHDSKGDE